MSKKILHSVTLFTLVLIFNPSISFAANSPKGIKVPSSSIFYLDGVNNAKITCTTVKRKMVSGRVKKGLFYPSTYTLTDLKNQIKKAKGKKLASLKKKLKSETTRIKALDGECALGPDPLTQLARPMTESDVRYLYEKTAFGAVTPTALSIGMTQGVSALVDYLMTPIVDTAVEIDSQKWLDENYQTDSNNVTQRGIQLWSLNLMLKNPNPFQDRLAFVFLHNLLATSSEVLTDSSQMPLMVDHLQKMRLAAVHGQYIGLLKEIARDPVMLIWLNGNENTKQQPNENFGRELMELFTLSPKNASGVPNYSETTVAQVARACTGWTVQRLDVGNGSQVWSSVFGEQIHDPDPAKVIFEGTPFQGLVNNDFDVINHIFAAHPDVDDYLAERILKEYLNENPSPRVLASAARLLRSSGFNINVVLKKLLKSGEFYSDANRDSVVAGPADKMIRFLRTTNIPYDLNTVRNGVEGGGQIIGMPPTVFGWDNPEWPTGQWLLSFVNTVNQVVRNDSLFNQRGFNYSMLLPAPSATVDQVIAHFENIFNVTLTPEQRQGVWIYMNNTLNNNNSYTADLFDANNATKVRRKIAGLIEIFTRHNDYQMR